MFFEAGRWPPHSPAPRAVPATPPRLAADTSQAANQAGIRRVLPKPVDFGRLIPLIEEVAGTP
jgi:hypothetical protein